MFKMSAIFAYVAVSLLCLSSALLASERTLRLEFGGQSTTYRASDLLKRSDVKDLVVERDVAYSKKMRYQAVPLLNLLPASSKQLDTIEARATDGFVSSCQKALSTRVAKAKL